MVFTSALIFIWYLDVCGNCLTVIGKVGGFFRNAMAAVYLAYVSDVPGRSSGPNRKLGLCTLPCTNDRLGTCGRRRSDSAHSFMHPSQWLWCQIKNIRSSFVGGEMTSSWRWHYVTHLTLASPACIKEHDYLAPILVLHNRVCFARTKQVFALFFECFVA
jgi:hypothetical protein